MQLSGLEVNFLVHLQSFASKIFFPLEKLVRLLLSPTKILQNPVLDPTQDFTGTYIMTVLSPAKMLQNPVQDDHPRG